jgi:hypothetical protein
MPRAEPVNTYALVLQLISNTDIQCPCISMCVAQSISGLLHARFFKFLDEDMDRRDVAHGNELRALGFWFSLDLARLPKRYPMSSRHRHWTWEQREP